MRKYTPTQRLARDIFRTFRGLLTIEQAYKQAKLSMQFVQEMRDKMHQ